MIPQTAPVAAPANAVLSVRNLSIDAKGADGKPIHLVQDVSFDVYEHEVLGLVGESGSGKSLTMLAVLGLLGSGLSIASGSIVLRGKELTSMSFADLQKVRGKAVSIIFQDPLTTLNPVLRIGEQIAEAIRLHNPDKSKPEVKARVIELLTLVGIPNPERRFSQFPNEFSGGMRQRVVIAMAMANEPDLLIADEPTTALDVTIQAQVMEVLAEVRARTGAAMVLITHDLGLVSEYADRLAVMYSGRIVEQAPGEQLFSDPKHPYTAGLIASLPQIDHKVASLYSIPGFVPDPRKRPSGCPFHPRCAIGRDRPECSATDPALEAIAPQRDVACHFYGETPSWLAQQRQISAIPAESPEAANDDGDVVLKVSHLQKVFDIGGAAFRRYKLHALRDISFDLRSGKTLGIVGESGCGKSTLARVLLRLADASGGDVFLNGSPLFKLRGNALRQRRRDLQVVFQDPYSSLDPRMKIHDVIAEPLRIAGAYSPDRVNQLLEHVGLPPEAGQRRSPEFSGGQRQRIAIARSLALNPDVLILDEAVSALDVSIQAQVINLLMKLQKDLGLTYVFISHDLSVVRHISDEVMVMYLGRVIEQGATEDVFDRPAHPYTRALLAAIPQIGGRSDSEGLIAKGDLPNPMSPPSGCTFRTRCPMAQPICAEQEPPLVSHGRPGHESACHFAQA
ncbi:peptide/nickel transport system ATP-binding protein [Devosia lucknowensis]|uniref:Peptide/nickel transport system ATP-binding protein n=1 Tax=Devosia lucknowensis TaxID=1096929 RepID=A0A1Y6GB62_9HYPH|nr:ABC transporter ATP-binding protein [Devosia lucknowensis]SMQ85687.1 peptide/nickel transport system ATP-binding protein [Devosia lucknowensis]